MRAVVQRVLKSSVSVDGKVVGQIGKGFNILLGVGEGDGEKQVEWLAEKIAHLRIFEDENGKTEVSFKMEIENVPEETEYKIIKGDVDGKFKIKYEKGKEKGFITVESVEGGYKLTYNNGYSEVI